MNNLTADVNLFTSFVAGVMSFLTPCVLPMVPIYLSYIAGTEEIEKNKILVLKKTVPFILGFSIIFILLGLTSSVVGKFLGQNKRALTIISGIIIIFFGLMMLGIFKIKYLERNHNLIKKSRGGFILGLAFAAGWTPCYGPILGSVLILAGGKDPLRGAILLLSYSVGMGIMFLLSGIFLDTLLKLQKNEKIISTMKKLSAVIMIIMGLILTIGGI